MPDEPLTTGALRIHLGVARGAGATVAMLDEGRRRSERGTRVVLASVSTHGRPVTAAWTDGLVGPDGNRVDGPATALADVADVLAGRPEVVLVDDLAAVDVLPDGSSRPRWRAADELLRAGVDVVGTLLVEEVESLRDVVTEVVGRPPASSVPDRWVSAGQVELVDITPAALRRRLAHGNVVGPEQLDAAAADYFRPGTLGALRELGLRWLADQVGTQVHEYVQAHDVGGTWETTERVVVAVTAAPGNDAVVRRAARIAARVGGELVGVHVRARRAGDGRSAVLVDRAALVEELGGRFVELTGDDVARTLTEFARTERATQVVVGASRRPWHQELLRGSVVKQLVRDAGGLDVHVIATDTDEPRERSAAPSGPAGRMRGWLALIVGLPLVVLVLSPFREELGVPASLLLVLTPVLVVAALGGVVPGVVAAVVGVLAANWFLVPPYHRLSVDATQDAVALVVFVVVGVVVATLFERVAHRSAEVDRARASTAALARSATVLATEAHPVPALVAEVRGALDARAVTLEVPEPDGTWRTVAASGVTVPGSSGERHPVGGRPGAVRVLHGCALDVERYELLDALTDELAVALESEQLQVAAERAEVLDRVEQLRTGILQAVSHDLRTPLAGIKTSVTSLIADDVELGAEDTRTFLRTIDAEVDRLDRVVGNLLDMSRVQSGSLAAVPRPTALEDVVTASLDDARAAPGSVTVDVPETLPLVHVDPSLLETAVANVVANALVVQPPGGPVRVSAARSGHEVVLQVVDRGPGIPAPQRAAVLEPFQRLGDRSSRAGVGLGLAIARGFVEATGGALDLGDTPGGGLTVSFRLPVVEDQAEEVG
jgi:two-component system sensor histidine kinase KdpD